MSYTEKQCESCDKKTIHDEDRCIECQPIKRVERTDALKAHGIISTDLMEPTKHPADGKYYTSPSKFRATTKAHGFEEVGNAYSNGYDPTPDKSKQEIKLARNIVNQIRERGWSD